MEQTAKDRIETERLVIRRWNKQDLADFHEYGSQPYVALRTGYQTHASLDESSQLLDKFIADPTKWAIELKQNGKVIGGIGLEIRDKENAGRVEREREIGYTMNQDFHGKGYGTEATKAMLDYAFNELRLIVVRIMHCDENIQSRRVIEKCGFKFEGAKRLADIWKFDGKLHDFWHYSITAEEWEKFKTESLN